MPKSLQVGVVGVGHLGSRHAQIYARLPGVRLVAVCDIDRRRAEALARQLGCEALTEPHRLIGRVQAASLAAPSSLHYPLASTLLEGGIHVLVEKPITTSLPDAQALIRIARRRRCVLQVGHVERFNAAFQAAMKHLRHPRFIEVHRLSPYPFRGTDVSVALDVMIHDLDVILALVRSPAVRLDAVGVPVLSASEDIANARIQFASGCIANLTSSRISDEPVRRIRVFQEDRYLSIDTLAQTVRLAVKTPRGIRRAHLPVNRQAPLEAELAAFIRSVRTGSAPLVSGEDGTAALALALRIERAMRRNRRHAHA